ncbi:MAG TPA: DASS family sodium-coupled anion symporter [Methanomicrobia archaeon]|nr:DASS family sodium-coupled anion symporter [Methanomicrobia archaeon]
MADDSQSTPLSGSSFYKALDFHKVGLIIGLIVFVAIVLAPHPASMDRSGYNELTSRLPDETLVRIDNEFGPVNEDNFREFLDYSKTIRVATGSTSPRFITEEAYHALDDTSSFKSPTTLYELIKGQGRAQMRVLALALLMAIWWITEAVPVPLTALLPMVLLPMLCVCNFRYAVYPGYFSAFEQYAHYLIFLFLGGFVIAAAMRRWGLDKRISLTILSIFGTKPSRIVLGFMVSTAFLSMWISNTATTALMMPVALAVLTQAKVRPGESGFGLGLMLSIAYAASIGGIGTLIGTPPNGIAAGFISQFVGKEVTFASWMRIGLPLVVIFLPIAWRYILWRCPPETTELEGGKNVIKDNLGKLGALSRGEKNTLVVFLITAVLWATRSSIIIGDTTIIIGWSTWFGGYFSWVHDSTVSILAVILLFLLPVNFRSATFTIDWKSVEKYVPWGTLLLFGGGLTLGQAVANTGMASWVASYLTMLSSVPIIVLLLAIVALSALLSEVTSNTGTASMLMPVMFALGTAMGRDPSAFMITAAVATSLVFMLPVATPPNAIVFGTGYVKIDKMAKTGIFLDMIGIIVWTLVLYFIVGKFFGIVVI